MASELDQFSHVDSASFVVLLQFCVMLCDLLQCCVYVQWLLSNHLYVYVY